MAKWKRKASDGLQGTWLFIIQKKKKRLENRIISSLQSKSSVYSPNEEEEKTLRDFGLVKGTEVVNLSNATLTDRSVFRCSGSKLNLSAVMIPGLEDCKSASFKSMCWASC